jgi:hypothetical protein
MLLRTDIVIFQFDFEFTSYLLLFREKVRVFTTLLGHKSSVASIKHLLQNIGVSSLTTTEFCQVRLSRSSHFIQFCRYRFLKKSLHI